MRKLRAEMHRRMLGNGYCARPVEIDCHFESICESCTFFVTTIEFRPTLQAQRDDADRKGQVGRQKIFDGTPRPPRHQRVMTAGLDTITRISTTPAASGSIGDVPPAESSSSTTIQPEGTTTPSQPNNALQRIQADSM